MRVEVWDEAENGPLSESAMRQQLEQRGYRVARYTYPPGTIFPEHSHAVDKMDAVLAGQFRLTANGQSVVLATGDCIAIPRGMVHRAEVVGNEAVISLDATKT